MAEEKVYGTSGGVPITDEVIARCVAKAEENLCGICMTPLEEAEPGERITNGMHDHCLLSNAIGHTVGACHCNPKMKDWSDRKIAIEAARRIREDWRREENAQ